MPEMQSIVAFATVSADLFGIGSNNVHLVEWAIIAKMILPLAPATKTDCDILSTK